MSKCVIHLKTVTLHPGSEPQRYELSAPGQMAKLKNGGFSVRYEDVSEDGISYRNELIANGDSTAVIKRQGDYTTKFHLDVEKKQLCMVSTPFGEISLGVLTHSIKNDLSDDGGRLCLKYSLDANNSHLSDNEIQLQIQL